MNSLTPGEQVLLASLIGAGGFAGMRTIKDLSNELNPKKEEDNADVLRINIPSARMPKIAGLMSGDALKNALQIAAPIAAVPASFLAAQKIDQYFKEKALKEKKDNIEKEYLSELSKVSEETPNVDNFCKGMLSEIEKNAVSTEYEPSLAAPARWVGRQAGDLWNTSAQPTWDKTLGPYMWLMALTGAGGAYGLSKYQDSKKEEAENKKRLPSKVELSVV